MNKKTAVVIIRFRRHEVLQTSNTDLNSHKKSVWGQGTRKPDAPTGNDRSSYLQSNTVANGNAGLKAHWQLEAGQDDPAKSFKQSGGSKRLVGEKEDLQGERERMQMEAKNLKQIRDLQGVNQKLEDELNNLKATLRGVQDKHFYTVKLLEERTADLKGAQTFLTTVDRYAGAEIMKMVEALNDEIFQGAGLVSELLENGNAFEVDEPRTNAQLTRDDRDYLTQFIGTKLLEHLSTNPKQLQVDPFPLQIAVQTIFTRWCVFMVDSFYLGQASDDLKAIYRRIWESGRRSCTKCA